MKKEQLLILAAMLGIAEDALTEENLMEELQNSFSAKDTEIENLTQVNKTLTESETALKEEIETLKKDKKDLDSLGEVGKQSLKAARESAVKNYRLSVGEEKVSTNIIALIEKSDYDSAKAFEQQYSEEVDEKFPLTCQKCNSNEVERKSSSSQGAEEEGELDNDQLAEKIKREKRKQYKSGYEHKPA